MVGTVYLEPYPRPRPGVERMLKGRPSRWRARLTRPSPSNLRMWLLETGSPRSFISDRKSTRLNSSHTVISYAVFCLKKKKQQKQKRNNKILNCNNYNMYT